MDGGIELRMVDPEQLQTKDIFELRCLAGMYSFRLTEISEIVDLALRMRTPYALGLRGQSRSRRGCGSVGIA
jgi:hypothetical protein